MKIYISLILAKAFLTDKNLLHEFYEQPWNRESKKPLGIVLISDKENCAICGGKLLIRFDRPSFVTVYTDEMGTVPATQFRKYCQNNNKGCSYTQHYGFCTKGEDSISYYDSDWDKLPYFLSTSMTAFGMSFLYKFDAELLIGQISYKQKCDIYNYVHKYDKKGKKVPVLKTDQESFVSDSPNVFSSYHR